MAGGTERLEVITNHLKGSNPSSAAIIKMSSKKRGPVTTHVLDTALGRPAVNVPITLKYMSEEAKTWIVKGNGVTDEDGRCVDLLTSAQPGTYHVHFDTAAYFATVVPHYTKMADASGEAVFSVALNLLPHHEDQPFVRHMHQEAHTERHRNTTDYVAGQHSPHTNRKNAGILLRRMSDDFNTRKFPDIVVRARKRIKSEGSIESSKPIPGTHAKMYRFIRRLSSTAISSTDPSPLPIQQSLPESTIESDNEEN